MPPVNQKGFSTTLVLLLAFAISTALLIAASGDVGVNEVKKYIPFGTSFRHTGLPVEDDYVLGQTETLDTGERFSLLIKDMKQARGLYSLYIKDLNFGQTYVYSTDRVFYAASLYKMPIAVAILKQVEMGKLSLDQKVSGGLTIDTTMQKLLKHSDNNAQVILRDLLSDDLLATAFSENSSDSRLTLFYHKNNSTTSEIADFFENLYKGDYLNKKNKAYLFEMISSTGFDDRISDHLTKGTYFTHKIGNWPRTGSWHDCGIVYGKKELVVCVMSVGTTFNDFLGVGRSIANFINAY